MAGTKMTLHRYSPVTLDFRTQEVIVDQTFIDDNGLYVPIDYPYTPRNGLLEVIFNGEFLLSGGGYEEVDDTQIRLDLGTDENGNPNQLTVGDELFIKVYQNHFYSRGEATVSGTEFDALRKEITEARQHKDTDNPFPTLDDRIDSIERAMEVINSGNADVTMEYEYNAKGQILREVVTGDYELVREFSYNSINEIEIETVYYDGKQTSTEYQWDLSSRRILRKTVRTS